MNADANSTSPSKEPKRTRWRWLRWLKWPLRALCALSVVFALCVLLILGWVWNTNRRGEAALEEILAELDRRGLPSDTYYLKKQFDASANGENAARFYEAAFAALGGDEAYEMSVPCVGSADMPELGEPIDRELQVKIATFLDKQQAFFSLLATARKHRRCFYDLDFNTREFQASGFLGDARQAARTLCVKSLHEQALGRPEGALDACEAIVDINLSLRNDPAFLVKLFQIVNGFYLYEGIHHSLSRTTPNAGNIEKLRAKLLLELGSMGFAEMLKAEIAIGAMYARNPHLRNAAGTYQAAKYEDMGRRFVMHEQDEHQRTVQYQDDTVVFEGVEPDLWPVRGADYDMAWASICPGVRRLAMVQSIEGTLNVHDKLQRARDTGTTDADVLLQWSKTRPAEDAPGGQGWRKSFSLVMQHQARLVVAAAALDAECFRIKNGKWPDVMSELHDERLLDPFSGKPLKYKQMDGDCIIYSIGMNQRDDAGVEDRDYGSEDHKDDIVFRLFAAEKRNVKPPANKNSSDPPPARRRRSF